MKTIAIITHILVLLVYFCQGIHGENTDIDIDTDTAKNSGSCWMDGGNSTAAFRHNQVCKAALEDERNLVNTYYMTSSASITALISGSLSAVSSLIILFLIRRSHIGLSSVYHQIICGISSADVVGSTAYAFNTLPLPKYMISFFDRRWVHGTQMACTIQVFFHIDILFH